MELAMPFKGSTVRSVAATGLARMLGKGAGFLCRTAEVAHWPLDSSIRDSESGSTPEGAKIRVMMVGFQCFIVDALRSRLALAQHHK